MKKALILAAAAMFCTTAAIAQGVGENAKPYIEVSGTAEKRVIPNKIDITVTLSQADSKGKIPMADLDKAFLLALKQAGIDVDKQVSLTDQSSSTAKKQSIYQFKNYMVVVSSAAEASNLFDCLNTNNIASAEIVNATRTDIREIQEQTKVEAIRNARETATVLTRAIDQKIGKAIQIQDFSTPYFGARNTMFLKSNAAAMDSAGAGALNDVQFQEIRIEQRITVRFELL